MRRYAGSHSDRVGAPDRYCGDEREYRVTSYYRAITKCFVAERAPRPADARKREGMKAIVTLASIVTFAPRGKITSRTQKAAGPLLCGRQLRELTTRGCPNANDPHSRSCPSANGRRNCPIANGNRGCPIANGPIGPA
jgi:hypothetical protein